MSKKSIVGTTSVGVLSSILAFFGVVSCCGMPILAGILAWMGIGASQLSFFAEYRYVFLGIAIMAILFGFWRLYFKKPKSCCTTGSCCGSTDKEEKPKSKLFQKIFLWIGAAVIVWTIVVGGQKTTAQQSEPLTPTVQVQEQSPGCCPR